MADLTHEEVLDLGAHLAAQLAAEWQQHRDAVQLSLEVPEGEPAPWGGATEESDRSPAESVSPTVDALIDGGAAAGVAVSEEVRRKVMAAVRKAVKKKSGGGNSSPSSAAS